MELDKDESGKVNLSYDKFVDLIFSIRSWLHAFLLNKYPILQ